MLANIISAFLPKRRDENQNLAAALTPLARGFFPGMLPTDTAVPLGGGTSPGAPAWAQPADSPVQPMAPTLSDPLHPNQSVREKYGAFPVVEEVVTPVGGTQTMPNQRRAATPATIDANASEKPNDTPVIPANEMVERSAVVDGFYPGMDAVAPNAVDPDARRRDAYAKRDDLITNGPKKEEKFWKRALRGALTGAASGQGIGGAIGGAVTGTALGGFFPQVDQAIRKPGEIALANQEIASIEGQRTADQKYQRGEVERQNIIEDNKRLREQGDARNEAKKKEGTWKALNRLVQQKHFDPKNLAHSRLATEAGIDPAELQGWDDRKPNEKMVAGVTYRLNAAGQYEPTNLPTDESKVLTDYEVTMPNGEKRKYRVSQRDAANFATQMSTLGARFEENARQRDFQAGENQKNRQLTLQRDALKAQMDIAVKQYDAAVQSQRQQESEAARARLMKLKEEYDALDDQ